jgi:hypothetical protein
MRFSIRRLLVVTGAFCIWLFVLVAMFRRYMNRPPRLSFIKAGMTAEEVEAALGEPIRKEGLPDPLTPGEQLRWYSGDGWGREIAIDFKDGKVNWFDDDGFHFKREPSTAHPLPG